MFILERWGYGWTPFLMNYDEALIIKFKPPVIVNGQLLFGAPASDVSKAENNYTISKGKVFYGGQFEEREIAHSHRNSHGI